MSLSVKYNRRSITTDLALEAHEFVSSKRMTDPAHMEEDKKNKNSWPPGIEVQNDGNNNIRISRIKVTSPTGEAAVGKPMGNYITLEIPGLRENSESLFEEACKALAKELVPVMNLKEKSVILVIGLGNWNVTPDALGPKVISSLMVTRHLFEYMPEELDRGVRPVCAVAPGVLGITGIETGEIVKGITEKVKPDIVIAIDALASRKTDRVNTTIQIADTGIIPGSGVGNRRMELSSKTLGVPVIALGVPTVVDAATLANDVIDLLIDNLQKQENNTPEKKFFNMLDNIDREEKYELIQEVLKPNSANLIVTPKEIDIVIERISKVIANGLNIALHQGITLKDIGKYVH